MTSIEEQIEITKNTLEVLEDEKRRRDEELLNGNSMLQILGLVKSFEKRLESVENRLQMLEENKKFNNLDDFPKHILGNLTSAFSNLKSTMPNFNDMNCEPQFVPMNFNKPVTEIDLPISDLDSASESTSESESESESELTDIKKFIKEDDGQSILDSEIDNVVKEELDELEVSPRLGELRASPQLDKNLLRSITPHSSCESSSVSEDEVSDNENNSVNNEELTVKLTLKSKPIDIIKNEMKPPSSPRSNSKTNPFQLNSSESSDDNKEKSSSWW